MNIKTTRQAGSTELMIEWHPENDEAANDAFERHGVKDGEVVEPELYIKIRETYNNLRSTDEGLTADDPDE